VPGISGREPKEISFKSLAYIIQSRMEEIIDAVNFEIQSSGYADKLSAGVVLTGGGSMLKHLPQLVKFKTAMDVRVGLPNENLSGTSREEINQPMFATSVGLIMRGFVINNKILWYNMTGTRVEEESDKQSESEENEAQTHDEAYAEETGDKIPWTEKLKQSLGKMFETEDQSIN